jgi:non-ribosomal peptide synthetase component F
VSYSIKIYEADGASPSQHREAEQRFRKALEETLGDESLVAPVYTAYLRIVAAYGDAPDLEALTDAERAIFEQWQAAESAAAAAAFGSHRYMGDAMYEITV